MKSRTVFFVSDRTGITAESVGLSLISQFDQVSFVQVTLSYVDTVEKANEAVKRIRQAQEDDDGARPIIFGTIIKDSIREIVKQSEGFFLDFFGSFIPSLEKELEVKSSRQVGKIHGVENLHTYNARIECVEFALSYDDGAKTAGYAEADVILTGVSRTGKTPASLYLAMQFGIRAANFPLTPDELKGGDLPKILKLYRNKIFGLTIEPERLQIIRSERLPNTKYSSLRQCKQEVNEVENLFQSKQLPFLSATNMSIEEMATTIVAVLGLERRFR